ncbi:MAG TPA: LppX_LprAFG lipoprotein [Marmoricola sp.]
MRTTRHRSLAAVVAGALLLAPLAGCGSDDDKEPSANASSSPTSSPSAAASSTTADPSAGSDDPAGKVAAPGERLTRDNLVATMVAAMRSKKTAHVELEVGSSMAASADTRYRGSTTDMRLSMDMGSTKAVVIMVGGTMYVQQSAGAKFLEIGPDDPALGNLVGQVTSMGPAAALAAMRGAVKEVQHLGTDEIGGDQVDKYRVTVDTTRIEQGVAGSPGVADLPDTVSYEMYVDDEHLLRQIDVAVAEQKIHMVVSKWGEPVDIAAPPASKIQNH